MEVLVNAKAVIILHYINVYLKLTQHYNYISVKPAKKKKKRQKDSVEEKFVFSILSGINRSFLED